MGRSNNNACRSGSECARGQRVAEGHGWGAGSLPAGADIVGSEAPNIRPYMGGLNIRPYMGIVRSEASNMRPYKAAVGARGESV